MAIQWGAYVGYVRLGIDITGSGGTYIIKLYVGWNGGVSFSGTISRGGSWSGSNAVNLNEAWGSSGTRDVYGVQQTFTGTRTYTASFPTPWGTASASRSITYTPPAPSVPKPGVPSNFKITRTGDTTATLSFTKGSNAASTQITANNPDKAWYNLANPTGTSQAVFGLKVNTRWGFNLYSKNSTGNSAVIGPYYMYTKPATPSAPTLAAGGKLTWTLPSLFKHGVELQRTDNGGSTVTTTTLGAVTTHTDSASWVPSTQFRVRCWAGPSHDQAKTYSDWSAWSKTWMTASYAPPKITKFTVARCNSAGELTEMGTYLKCVYSGATVSVKDGATETNWATRRVKWRKKGTATWSVSTLANKTTPGTFTNMFATVGGGAISVTEVFEVAFELEDAYSGTVQQIVTVPVAQVAFSIAERGVGVGKTWERGALDVAGDTHLSGLLYGGFISGVVTIKGNGTPGNTAEVTFPPGVFTSPPLVFATKQTANLAKAPVYVTNISTSGCTIGFYTGDGSNIPSGAGVPIAWIAVPQ